MARSLGGSVLVLEFNRFWSLSVITLSSLDFEEAARRVVDDIVRAFHRYSVSDNHPTRHCKGNLLDALSVVILVLRACSCCLDDNIGPTQAGGLEEETEIAETIRSFCCCIKIVDKNIVKTFNINTLRDSSHQRRARAVVSLLRLFPVHQSMKAACVGFDGDRKFQT